MALHFKTEEFNSRIARAQSAMQARGLDGMLLFQQESMYYLTGYDTFGFCFFQCLYLSADGKMALLTRSADLRQAQHTSIIEDIRIWKDSASANPAIDLRNMVESLGGRGKRLGVETKSYGLTHANGKMLDAAFDGFCTLVEATDLIDHLRLIKSPAELKYVRKAGRLGDEALKAAIKVAKAGADEGKILAAQHNAIFAGGGDYPGNEFIIGSSSDALLCRYKSGRRKLSRRDQLTLEFAGVYRHYHAAFMRTLIIGKPSRDHEAMDTACQAALVAVEDKLQVGNTAGDVFNAHARVMDEHGMKDHRLNACGYSLGAKFTPSWMDVPMFYDGNEVELGAGMVFFAHMILMDSDNAKAYCLGRTYILTEGKPEPVSRHPLGMILR
jgi:Xaa-Pro dipeptidase